MEQIQEQINKLQMELDKLKNSTTIPKEIGDAFSVRILSAQLKLGPSSSLPATFTQAVNEGGVATYSVSKPMTGFIAFTFNGIVYNVPYF